MYLRCKKVFRFVKKRSEKGASAVFLNPLNFERSSFVQDSLSFEKKMSKNADLEKTFLATYACLLWTPFGVGGPLNSRQPVVCKKTVRLSSEPPAFSASADRKNVTVSAEKPFDFFFTTAPWRHRDVNFRCLKPSKIDKK